MIKIEFTYEGDANPNEIRDFLNVIYDDLFDNYSWSNEGEITKDKIKIVMVEKDEESGVD